MDNIRFFCAHCSTHIHIDKVRYNWRPPVAQPPYTPYEGEMHPVCPLCSGDLTDLAALELRAKARKESGSHG